MKKYLFILFTTISILAKGNINKIDSLKVALEHTKSPEKRAYIIDAIINLSQQTNSPDIIDYVFAMSRCVDEVTNDSLAAIYKADCAIHFLNQGIYDQSLTYLLEARDYFTEHNMYQSITAVENSLGAIYTKTSQHNKAKEHFTNAMRAFELVPIDSSSLYRKAAYSIYNNIAIAYQDYSNDLDSAKYYYKKSHALLSNTDAHSLASIYHNLAYLYTKQNKLDSAKYYALQAKENRIICKDKLGYMRTNTLLAGIFAQLKDFDTAFKLAHESYTASKKIQHKETMLNSISVLTKSYEAKGLYKEALKYYQEQMSLTTIIQQDSIVSKLRSIESEYKFDKYLTQVEIETREAKFQYRVRFIIGIFILVLSIIVSLYIMSRYKIMRMEKERLFSDLELKNKKLTSNVMQLMQNTELMKDIISRIIKLKLQTKGEVQQELHSIVFSLEKNLKGDLWREFDTYFNDVHLDFYKRITNFYPELSPNERKICALLRLNMSSKEIAAIAGITVKSVEVMRVRIRKKLQLSNTDINLVTFLCDL